MTVFGCLSGGLERPCQWSTAINVNMVCIVVVRRHLTVFRKVAIVCALQLAIAAIDVFSYESCTGIAQSHMGTLQVRGSKELLLADVVEIKFLLGGNCSFADEIVSDTVGSSTADCVAEFEQTPPSIAAIKFIFGTVEFARIESTTVLKDAASNALYGARGANGVVLITT